MPSSSNGSAGRVIAFLDLGTNSARLLLVRLNPNHSYTILTQQKEVVRLGEGEFREHRLQPEAMQRAALVCRNFAEMARSFGATEIHAVATAACREARNKLDFVRLLRQEAQIDLRVVSGREEARLIYLGVSSGINLNGEQALFIDVGGGSTELIVGTARQYKHLDSLRLGAIRLTAQFFGPDDDGPVSPKRYARILRHVRNEALRALQRLKPFRLERAVGSSGTILTLAELAAHQFLGRPWQREDVLERDRLRGLVRRLCELPLKERRKVPGMNPRRADIILAGAAIVETLMNELELHELRVSDRGLRDGLLVDFLARTGHPHAHEKLSVRERSVLQLGRSCNFDEFHARQVSRLALAVFDGARSAGLHKLGDGERELLNYAALLHDVGVFLSFNNHQLHSYYFIRNADLLGMDQTEIDIVATTALFHRKAAPRKSHAAFAALDESGQQTVRLLCLFLRLAESLDRSHAGLVQDVRLRVRDKKNLVLEVRTGQECPLELWGVHNHFKTFKKVFDRKLAIEMHLEMKAAVHEKVSARLSPHGVAAR